MLAFATPHRARTTVGYRNYAPLDGSRCVQKELQRHSFGQSHRPERTHICSDAVAVASSIYFL
jgi:hypothetical protein